MAEKSEKEKRYYWIKLKEGFFKEKEIKKLRKIAGGDTYTIIYLKLMLLSLCEKGYLYYDGIEETFYEELALEIDEEAENVKVTLIYLAQMGLMIEGQTSIYLTRIPEVIGSETAKAEYMRKKRAREKAQKELNGSNNVTTMLPPVTECYTETETEQKTKTEQEIEQETESEIDSKTDLHTDIDVTELNARQKDRVDFLRELFVGWEFNDYQIFHLSTLVNKRLPYDLSLSLDQQDLRIYDALQEIVYLAKATPNIQYPFNWFCGVIEKYKGFE